MRSFLEVLRFELRLQLGSPMLAGLTLLFFAIHLLTMSQTGIHLSDNQLMDYNSAYLIFRTELVLSVFGMTPAVIFVVGAATRDHALGTSEFYFTTPAPRLAFLLGRFCGGLACALLVGVAGVAGEIAGTFMPWLDADRVAAFAWQPYAMVFATVVAPNILVFSAFAFGLAALSRGPVLSFAMALSAVVLGLVGNTFLTGDGPAWLTLLDPFGAMPVERLVRFWTVSELNTVLPTAMLWPNRALWLALAALALALTCWRFRMAYAEGGGSSLRRTGKPQAPPALTALAQQGSFRARDTALQFASQWRMDMRGVLLSPLFWLVVALTILATLNEIQSNVSVLMQMPLHPVTSQMLGFMRYGMIQFVLIVIVFYSGLLMHREREHGLHEIVGAAPYPDWLPLAAKVLCLSAVLIVLLSASVLTSIAWQLSAGQYDVQPLVYLQSVFVFSGFYFCMLAVLACLLQLLAPGKWSGMLLVTAAVIALVSLEPAGFEHLLYGFRIPFVVHSDMNGFGHFVTQTWSLIVYWAAFCVLLLVAGHLLFPRGAYAGLFARIRQAGQRFTPAVRAVTAAAGAVFLLSGAWIFYNTNILNEYTTPAGRLERNADYERRYGAYRQAPSPAVTDIDLAVDLFPRERRLESRGRATLRNTTAAPLTQVFVSVDPRLAVETLAVDGGALASQDRRQGVFLFKLASPLAPGAETAMTWGARRANRGFVNSDPDNRVVENGTFVDIAAVMPQPNYDGERELTNAGERKRARLPPAPRLPALGDPAWLNKIGFGSPSRTDFHLVFSTDADQIGVAPGVLTRAWTQGSRRYFDYRMERPIPPAISLTSARYAVARRRWGGVDIEIYYEPRHAWNVRTMLDTSETALAYFSREFAPYPLSHFRVAEFAGYSTVAQAHAGAINYSEKAGFINDLRGWAPIDYTTTHELAHQWWGGLAYGARMQGRQILNEGLAQYSTFMIFKQQANPIWVRKILASTNAGYLTARSEESEAERPVILSEDQGYISYNKAALAIYALQELIGAEKVHQGLRAYLARFAMKPAPYPTSRDLVNELRAVAGPQHQSLITDLFEKIMLYDVQMTAASVRRVGAEYEVTMDITARQFEADGAGKETEVPLDTWFQVVVFPASDRGLLALQPLYQAHHKLRSGKQRVVVRVPKAPGAAGVDPFHLMIDRTPANNTLRLGN